METTATAPKPSLLESLLSTAQKAYRSEAFWPAMVALAGLTLTYWSLLRILPNIYNSPDGYYSHGWIVPVISAYIVYRWWPRLKTIPVKPSWVPIVLLIPLLYVTRLAYVTDFVFALSFAMMFTILLGIWFVAGVRWMFALALPVLYLGFGLPLWTMAIDNYTNPLQIYSTKVAFQMLQMMGFEPYMQSSNKVLLANFSLDVGVPCSGLKLVLAVTAFTVFFMLIGGLRWWANLIMIAFVLPLCLFINGLRIALIGVVGDMYGSDAGHAFHDYSGYLTLIVCFVILFRVARWLGWKD